jgi:hypothetical protein
MKAKNMTSKKTGRAVPNQFVIEDEGRGALGNFTSRRVFQSYTSIIAKITIWPDKTRVELDENKWDYSKTTSRYRNQFLDETTKETQAKIDSGEYILTDLN